MFKKSISLLLIIFLFFSFINTVYATEEENNIEIQEEEETEIEETNEEETEETITEENQEEQTENIVIDYSETLENISQLLDRIDKSLAVLTFYVAVWIIIDFIRHSFFIERS